MLWLLQVTWDLHATHCARNVDFSSLKGELAGQVTVKRPCIPLVDPTGENSALDTEAAERQYKEQLVDKLQCQFPHNYCKKMWSTNIHTLISVMPK